MTGDSHRLHVLMVNTHATRGGAARMASTLAQALHASGEVDVSLVHCGDDRTDPPLYGIRRPGSRPLNALLARLGGSLAVQDMGVADEISRRSQTADLIHLHNLHGYYLDWVRLLRAIGDRPLVWTLHDMWAVTGRCGFAYGCDGWRTGCRPCPHLDYYPAAWVDRAASEYERKTERLGALPRLIVATPSHWLGEIAVRRGFRAERVVYVPNPVDVSSYRPTAAAEARRHFGLDPAERHLLFVAADCNNPLKGYSHFLATVKRTGWRGLVAGGAPKELPAGVRYLGSFADPSLLSLCYSAADALVVPSLFDNSPNAVIESMACGTPAFGFDAGGIASQMHPRWGGVVKTGDDEALATLLSGQLAREGKTQATVEEVREYAASHWSSDSVAKRYLELYRRAVDTA